VGFEEEDNLSTGLAELVKFSALVSFATEHVRPSSKAPFEVEKLVSLTVSLSTFLTDLAKFTDMMLSPVKEAPITLEILLVWGALKWLTVMTATVPNAGFYKILKNKNPSSILFNFEKKTFHSNYHQYGTYYALFQCCGSGSGSTGSTWFWASQIRILLSSCKNSKKP
jgi:hypothetical protein